MKPYSIDLRERVLAACDDGSGTSEVAESFGVSEAWVRRLKQRRRETGLIGPRTPARSGPPPVLADQADRLRRLVRDHPGLSSGEYRDRLGVDVVALTVWRALRRLGYTFKKSPSGRRNRTGRTSPPAGRHGGRR
jgi:transposase